MIEPVRHPTYGTLEDLARTIERERDAGNLVRMGLIGALAWFIRRYQEAA